MDPQFEWNAIPGAAKYEIEVNTSTDFAAGSKVCCTDPTIGTSLSPTKLLANNTDLPGAQDGYHWRVRAIDLDGNAGEWTRGQTFKKVFDHVPPTVPGLRITTTWHHVPSGGATSAPIVDWEPVPGASSYEVRVVPWTREAATGSTASVGGSQSRHLRNGVDTACVQRVLAGAVRRSRERSTSWSPTR